MTEHCNWPYSLWYSYLTTIFLSICLYINKNHIFCTNLYFSFLWLGFFSSWRKINWWIVYVTTVDSEMKEIKLKLIERIRLGERFQVWIIDKCESLLTTLCSMVLCWDFYSSDTAENIRGRSTTRHQGRGARRRSTSILSCFFVSSSIIVNRCSSQLSVIVYMKPPSLSSPSSFKYDLPVEDKTIQTKREFLEAYFWYVLDNIVTHK